MSKPIKQMVTAELRRHLDGVDSACVVDLAGMGVLAQEQLRVALREKSARLRVVKNSLAKQAFQDTPLAPLGDVLEGPCALVTSSEPLLEAAKVLVAAAKEHSALTLKQALIDGDPNLLTVVALSRMKGRIELLGEIAMLVASPGRAMAGCMTSPQSKLAGCLKAIVDKAA